LEVLAQTLERSALAMRPAEVRKMADAALLKNGQFKWIPNGQAPSHPEKTLRLHLEVFVESADSPEADDWVKGILQIQWKTPEGPLRMTVDAAEDLPRLKSTAEARKQLQSLLENLVAKAHATYSAGQKKDEALLADLKGQDSIARDLAAQVLVERRNPAVIPVLEKQLQEEDPQVFRRAMGGLVELKVRSSVPVLIDLARGKDLGFLREVIFALGSIGGEEAEAYLFTVSQGHEQPLIREAAEEALAELRGASRGGKTP
jgi:hypothetical protein